MSERDNGGPAFPVQDASKWQAHGMTMRDWFAGQALHGLIAHRFAVHTVGNEDTYSVAAYTLADAMLAERDK